MAAKNKFMNAMKMPAIADMFSSEADRQRESGDLVTEVPLSELHPFVNHPFEVRDDEDMQKLVDSIKENGVLTNLTVRPRAEGGYEIISGHRRFHAAQLAGLDKIKVQVRDVDDDQAIIDMVDANIQREHISPMEKARAYAMKLEAISDLVTNHPECSNVEFHYEYEDGHTWSSYWPEVLAVFAVNQNLNGDDDVIVIDREKADLLIDTFWMMHRIESEVEEVVLPADSGDGSEESEDTETQTEYILHITVTSVPVDDLAHDLSFTDDQMDILHQLLSDEMRPMLVQMCGTGTSTGTVPPVVDGSMIWPLPGHTSLTTHFGEADAFGNPGHRGIDIPAPEGTPILAAHSGTVLICGWNDSFGNQVLIDDGAGLSTRYAHMTATAVSPGAVVTAGQVIGYVGSTGDSTGNHLHFEVSVGGTLADPLEYVLPQ